MLNPITDTIELKLHLKFLIALTCVNFVGCQSILSINENAKAAQSSFPKKLNEDILLPFCVARKQCGYIKPSGEIIVAAELEKAGDFRSNGFALIKKDGKWGVLDQDGNIAISTKFDELREFNKGLAPFKMKSEWGYVNQFGVIVIPPKFKKAAQFSNNGLAAVKLQGKIGFIDRTGSIVIPPKFEEAGNFNKYGLARVKVDGGVDDSQSNSKLRRRELKSGYIDQSGNFVIPAIFDKFWRDFDTAGLVKVEHSGKQGMFNAKGDEVLPPIYDEVSFYPLSDSGKWNSYIKIKKSGKIGLADTSGNIVMPPKYDYLYQEKDNKLIKVGMDGRYGYIDKFGKVVMPLIYESIRYSPDGEFWNVIIDGKWGVVDKTGKIVLPAIYDSLGAFNKFGIAGVQIGDSWGFINREGDMIVPPIYDFAFSGNADDEYARVSFKDIKKMFIIDQETLKIISPPLSPFFSISLETDYSSARGINQGDKTGLMNNQGEIFLPIKFKSAYFYSTTSPYVGYGTVNFGRKKYPFKYDGSLIGFTLEDVDAVD